VDTRLSIVYLLKTLGKHFYLAVHLTVELVKFMFFGFSLLLSVLALLDKEEVLFLEVSEYIKKLVRVFKVQFVLVVRVFYNLS
jgi:hypothetical protein